VVQPDVGDGQGDDQWEQPGSRHVLGQSEASKPIDVSIHLWWGRRPWCGHSCWHHLAQSLDDAHGCDVSRAVVHDVEHLVALVGAGVRVRVVIDGLKRPLGILECHLLIVVALQDDLLLSPPTAGEGCRHDVAVGFVAHGTAPQAS
jgi:hypothetical protein